MNEGHGTTTVQLVIKEEFLIRKFILIYDFLTCRRFFIENNKIDHRADNLKIVVSETFLQIKILKFGKST